MYQHMRLHEFSVSMRMLLTGFILAICGAGAFGVAEVYQFCRNLDGKSAISLRDLEIYACGAELSPLEEAAASPQKSGLGGAGKLDIERIKEWCRNGAPRAELAGIQRILKGSIYERAANRGYDAVAPLAGRRHRLSSLEMVRGTTVYLLVVSLAFLGLGLMFLRTSLFEKTKVFFVSSTFVVAVACPLFLWLGRRHSGWLYPMLFSALLLVVCFGVLALVALFDLWCRRAVT